MNTPHASGCVFCGAPRAADAPTCAACESAIRIDELPPCVGAEYADTAADLLRDPESRA